MSIGHTVVELKHLLQPRRHVETAAENANLQPSVETDLDTAADRAVESDGSRGRPGRHGRHVLATVDGRLQRSGDRRRSQGGRDGRETRPAARAGVHRTSV